MKHFFVILYIYLTTLASYEVRNYGYYILYYVFPSKKNIILLCMKIETHMGLYNRISMCSVCFFLSL